MLASRLPESSSSSKAVSCRSMLCMIPIERESFVVWSGISNDVPACRVLGHRKEGYQIFAIPSSPDPLIQLSHNEGTSTSGWTSPSIGTGDTKIMRDHEARGYAVGIWPDDLSTEPLLITREQHHILAYDLECEYSGDATITVESTIMCVCLA